MRQSPDPGHALRYCGLSRRVLALAYDGLIIIGLWMLATLAALPLTHGEAFAPGSALFQGYLLLIAWLYYTLSWRMVGQTLGMRAWRIFLVSPETPVGWGRSLLRFIVAWMGLLPLGLGWWWSLWHPQKAGWQDLVSGTRLVIEHRGRLADQDRPGE